MRRMMMLRRSTFTARRRSAAREARVVRPHRRQECQVSRQGLLVQAAPRRPQASQVNRISLPQEEREPALSVIPLRLSAIHKDCYVVRKILTPASRRSAINLQSLRGRDSTPNGRKATIRASKEAHMRANSARVEDRRQEVPVRLQELQAR
jgi:hypothetical protein